MSRAYPGVQEKWWLRGVHFSLWKERWSINLTTFSLTPAALLRWASYLFPFRAKEKQERRPFSTGCAALHRWLGPFTPTGVNERTRRTGLLLRRGCVFDADGGRSPYNRFRHAYRWDENATGGRRYFFYHLVQRLRRTGDRRLPAEASAAIDAIRHRAQNAADDSGADTIHMAMLTTHALPGVMGNHERRVPGKTQESVEAIRGQYRIADLAP